MSRNTYDFVELAFVVTVDAFSLNGFPPEYGYNFNCGIIYFTNQESTICGGSQRFCTQYETGAARFNDYFVRLEPLPLHLYNK
ncbi:MAG: hypothetical protein K2X86_06885 [Cytophagaceae bacterium]|nr:hypothetical protein [Cytophagaceae bacterium]